MNSNLRAILAARARHQCEYCRIPQSAYVAPFNIDHIIASQHLLDDSPENLAYCCPPCNRKKGPNLSWIDPSTRLIVTLFHPRNDQWTTHFRWNGPLIVGVTTNGRATAALLEFNQEKRVRLRQALLTEGVLLG
jgi:hypothetical protein